MAEKINDIDDGSEANLVSEPKVYSAFLGERRLAPSLLKQEHRSSPFQTTIRSCVSSRVKQPVH
jgi:hypothetical protein